MAVGGRLLGARPQPRDGGAKPAALGQRRRLRRRELVGFLRLVTDRATFAWVCDVYVDPAARGLGVGKLLVAEADRLLSSYGVRRAMLATADAHGLYTQHGFASLTDVERYMSRGYEQ